MDILNQHHTNIMGCECYQCYQKVSGLTIPIRRARKDLKKIQKFSKKYLGKSLDKKTFNGYCNLFDPRCIKLKKKLFEKNEDATTYSKVTERVYVVDKTGVRCPWCNVNKLRKDLNCDNDGFRSDYDDYDNNDERDDGSSDDSDHDKDDDNVLMNNKNNQTKRIY